MQKGATKGQQPQSTPHYQCFWVQNKVFYHHWSKAGV